MAGRRALLIGISVVVVVAAWLGLRSRDTAPTIVPPTPALPADEAPPTRVPPMPDAPPGRSWTGRVLAAETGAAVADAIVRVKRRVENAKQVETRSGPDGTFRLDDLAPGDSHVEVGPRDFAGVAFDVDVVHDMRRDVFVPAGVLVTGVVFDGDRRVEGAVVAREDGVASAPTGSDGTYRLAGVASGDEEGNASLHVTAPGIAPQDVQIHVPLGPTRLEADLHLERPWRVHGRVLADGKPVAGATVSVLQMQSTHDPTTTDALGAFTLTSLCGRAVQLVAYGADARSGRIEKLEFPGDGDVATDVEIHLAAPVVVRGFVHDESGAPVAGAHVRMVVDRYAGDPPPFECVSGSDGRFATRLPDGNWAAVVSAGRFFTLTKGRLQPPDDIAPRPSETSLEFELKRGGSVVGRVHDRAGKAVAGVHVSWARYLHDCRGETKSDVDGRFEFDGLPEEKVGVRVERDGYVSNYALQIDPTTGAADLVIDHESVIRGVVLLPDGVTPAKSFAVRLYEEATDDDKPWNGRVWSFRDVQFNGADGRFELRDIEPGTIRVEAASGVLVTPRERGVRTRAEGASIDMRLVLAPGARIAGRVTDSARRPIANATVGGGGWQPEEDNCRWDCAARTDADGRFDLPGLADGDYMLRVGVDAERGADRAPFMQREIHLKLAASETAAPEIVLLRPGGFDVKALDPDGKAIDGCWVGFVREDGEVSTESWTGTADDVAPGRHRARVRADGFQETETTIEIEEGKVTKVAVTLKRE